MDVRVPAHLEVSGLIRRVQAEGGFAMVLQKGERDAGAILVVLTENGTNSRLYERMPTLEGTRVWHCAQRQNAENPAQFQEYVNRRQMQDPDSWVIELDIVDGERFIDITPETRLT